jgi:transposase
MPQVDIITGDKRRRVWTPEEKMSILSAAFAPGAVAAHVARRVNVTTGQLYTWRKELTNRKPSGGGFSQIVAVADPPAASPLPPAPDTAPMSVCELPAIELQVRGHKLRIPGTMPPALAAAIVKALAGRR